ncbi:MAG: ATP-dependent zinc metalloprotease FtsH [Myxococcales bacterium]
MAEPSPESGLKRPRGVLPFLLLLGLLGVLLLLQMGKPSSPGVPYSDLKRLIEADLVASLVIGDEDIVATLRPDANVATAFGGSEVQKPQAWETVQKLQGGGQIQAKALPGGDEALVPLLEKHGVSYRGQRDGSGAWIVALSWLLPLLLVVGFFAFMARRAKEGQGALQFGKSKVRVYKENDVKTTFADVAGVDEAKAELEEIIEYLRRPERYITIGARIPKGVLLIGPPGTGKTLLARAVAGEARVAFFSISGSEFVEMFVGVGAARVRDLFEQALKSAPCIIFVDELDALGKTRGAGMMTGNDEREQTLNQLLVEMDGFDANTGVVMMAATNRPEILDPALLRAGRFDRQVLVDRPDKTGRLAILKVHSIGVKLGPDVDLELLAARTPGFVGADLANLINEAALLAARRSRESVSMAELEEAVERVVAGLEKKGRIITEPEKRRVAAHEIGHALIAELVDSGDPVHKISIVPRGMNALGYTLQLPTEDRYLMTEGELQDKLAVLLGGRCAEELVYGEPSTGAQNDLVRATDIARSMVLQFGMSPALGPVTFEEPGGKAQFLTPDMAARRRVGEKTADLIDQEVRRLLDDAHARVMALLKSHRGVLDMAAQELIDHEYLDGARLREMLKANGVSP